MGLAKGQEALARKRGKAARKRLQKIGLTIAAKRRRKDGHRRICEAMCYSLPTPDDPFNDRSKGRRKRKDSRPEKIYRKVAPDNEPAEEMMMNSAQQMQFEAIAQLMSSEGSGCWVATDFEKKCWEACAEGVDVVGVVDDSRSSAFAYIPAAAYCITKEAFVRTPLALILVSSKEESLAVRKLYKPLQTRLRFKCVSIHPATSVELQMQGLNASMPELLVATPQRLCELIKAKAINLLNLSFLVIENLAALIRNGFQQDLVTIKLHTNSKLQSMILSERFSDDEIKIVEQFTREPVTRVTRNSTVKDLSACIKQRIYVMLDASKKLPKLMKILGSRNLPQSLILVNSKQTVKLVLNAIAKQRKSITTMQQFKVITEDEAGCMDLKSFECVVLYDFPSCMKIYEHMVSSISRRSIKGVIHTFCTSSMASSATNLITLLRECSQQIPSPLQMLADAAAATV